ncbi:hypothetical protein ZWY2020_036390 [Hordeum vulgare]|nr:hypothetical protein ZWY2020_036390 [Hordeum vulgare]
MEMGRWSGPAGPGNLFQEKIEGPGQCYYRHGIFSAPVRHGPCRLGGQRSSAPPPLKLRQPIAGRQASPQKQPRAGKRILHHARPADDPPMPTCFTISSVVQPDATV